MTPFLQLSLALAILIAAAKIGGYLSYRLGQPSVLGELIVGILLGPSLFDILHLAYFTDTHLPEVVHEFAEVGVLLLMFLAGLELDIKDLARTGRVATLAGTLGVILPIALGAIAGLAFGMNITHALFIGLILAATSVSISAQTLMELNMLRSRVGFGLLGSAVFDDILVVLCLSIFTALTFATSPTQLSSIIVVILRMAIFLIASAGIGLLILPRASRRVNTLPVSQGLTAFTVVTILLYGWASEELGGMAAITGAFMAGLVFARSPVKERIENNIVALAYGLFVPIFFIDVGLTANIRNMAGESLWLFLALTLAAVIGKVVGSGAGGLLGGLSRREALQLGLGMMSRGEVGLIVASVGVKQGIITEAIFSAVVGVVIITTLLTPPLLRASFRGALPLTSNVPPKNKTQRESTTQGDTSE
jgi:Kef-type K+ transport system membrane component KefB